MSKPGYTLSVGSLSAAIGGPFSGGGSGRFVASSPVVGGGFALPNLHSHYKNPSEDLRAAQKERYSAPKPSI